MIYELLNQYKLKYLYQWTYLKIKNIQYLGIYFKSLFLKKKIIFQNLLYFLSK